MLAGMAVIRIGPGPIVMAGSDLPSGPKEK